MDSLGKNLLGFVKNTEQVFHKGLDEATDEMETNSKYIIKEHVKHTASGIVKGKDNRIWTGAMLNNADAKKTKTGAEIKIEYGWFGFGSEDYVQLQEEGGRHVAFGMESFVNVQHHIRDILGAFEDGRYFK